MSKTNSLLIVAVGDVYLTRDGPASAFQPTAHLIAGADLAFCNLESPVSELGRVAPGRSYPLGAHPRILGPIVNTGFNLVSLAHNHALDYGEEAFLDTLRQVSLHGLAHTGAGADLAQASTPAIIEAKGQRLACLAYACAFPPGTQAGVGKPGVAAIRVRTLYDVLPELAAEHPGWPPVVHTEAVPADVERLRANIESAASLADVVFVSFHWGVPGSSVVLAYQQSLAHIAIDAGAAAILGHHPHTLQGVEFHRDRPIFYSLANFAFDLEHPTFSRETVLARWKLRDGVPADVELVPLWIDDLGNPQPATGTKFSEIQRLLERLSAPLGSRVSSRDGCLIVTGARGSH